MEGQGHRAGKLEASLPVYLHLPYASLSGCRSLMGWDAAAIASLGIRALETTTMTVWTTMLFHFCPLDYKQTDM